MGRNMDSKCSLFMYDKTGNTMMWCTPTPQIRLQSNSMIYGSEFPKLSHTVKTQVTKHINILKLCTSFVSLTCYSYSSSTIRAVPSNSNPGVQANSVESMAAWQAQEIITLNETLQAYTAILGWFWHQLSNNNSCSTAENLQLQTIQSLLSKTIWFLVWCLQESQSLSIRAQVSGLEASDWPTSQVFSPPGPCFNRAWVIIIIKPYLTAVNLQWAPVAWPEKAKATGKHNNIMLRTSKAESSIQIRTNKEWEWVFLNKDMKHGDRQAHDTIL